MYRKMKSEASAADAPTAMHLECVDKIGKIPVVEMVVNQTTEIYDKVKGSSSVANWTLSTAEATVNKVVEQAGVPVARCLEQPIHLMDQTLCRGITTLEHKLPMVKETPQEMLAHAKGFVTDTATTLKDYGWNKANDMLSTKWGSIALSGFDRTTSLADKYLDLYLPPIATEAAKADPQVVIALPAAVMPSVNPEDKVGATLDSVGRLSSKVRSRLYEAVLANVQGLKHQSEESIASLGSLLELMHVDSTNVRAKVNTLWNELSAEGEEVEEGEQRTVLVARRLARRVANFCSHVPAKLHELLPATLAQQMQQAATYTTSLYDSLMVCEKTGVANISESVRANMREQVSKIQVTLHDFNVYTVQLMDAFTAKSKQLTEEGETQTAQNKTPKVKKVEAGTKP